jgi:hypothetical protein
VKTYLVVNQSTRTVEVTVHKDDYDATIALLLSVIAQLDAKTVARL